MTDISTPEPDPENTIDDLNPGQASTVGEYSSDQSTTDDDHHPTIDKAQFERVTPFIIQLAAAAHRYGASSPQLSAYMHQLCKAAKIDAYHLITPLFIWHIFSCPGEIRQFGYLDKVGRADFDLGKLAELSAIVNKVCKLEMTLATGFKELKELSAKPQNYGKWTISLGYLISGGAFAVILDATWWGVALGAVMSIVLFAFTLLATKSNWISKSFDLSSAFVIGLLTCLVASLFPSIDPVSAALAGVVVIIPGYTLTLGIAELTNQKVLSGSERLIAGILSSLKLFFGASVGATIVIWIFGRPEAVPSADHATYFLWISAAILTLGLALVFQVSPRDLLWVVVGGVLAYGGTVIGAEWGVWQGPLIGSLLLALFGAFYSILSRRPASIITLTGIMVLVPGASAILGINIAHSGGISQGLQVEWNAFLTILAIVTGQIIANTLVSTRVPR